MVYLITSTEALTAVRGWKRNCGNLISKSAIRNSPPSMATHPLRFQVRSPPERTHAFGRIIQRSKAPASKGITVHVMEDDVELSPQLEQIIWSLDEGGAFDDFDIVFTDTAVDFDLELMRKYKTIV